MMFVVGLLNPAMDKPSKCLLRLLPLLMCTTCLCGQTAPKGFTIPDNTLSPDKHYGVTVPLLAEDGEIDDPKNSLVDVKTGRIAAVIQANPGWDRMNRGGVLPARWSTNSTLLLWEVEGRFSPTALALLKIEDNKLAWQVDLLAIVQQAILTRTREAAPGKYAAAERWNKGSGSAYPDGFTVNVRADGDKERGGPGEDVKGKPVSLPLRVHAELTSNPKEIENCPKDAQIDSELDGVINHAGKWTVGRFHLRKKPFDNATASSWLELTDPAAARHPPLEYGDVISLKGEVTTEKDEAGKSVYFLHLSQKISVRASTDDPAEENVSTVRLIDFPIFPLMPDLEAIGTLDIDGTLGHNHTNKGPALTLKVHTYGYGSS